MKSISMVSRLLLFVLIPVALGGCMASVMAGEVIRAGQKKQDVVLGRGVTPDMLQQKANMGISVNGIDQQGQIVFTPGQGNSNANVLSDMLVKEFLRMGYQARTLAEPVSESSTAEALDDLATKGFDIVVVGSMNLGMSSSVLGVATGGNMYNTGVTSYTLKGVDVPSGDILFILSTEYGKAKNSGDVAHDVSVLYQQVLDGEAPVANSRK